MPAGARAIHMAAGQEAALQAALAQLSQAQIDKAAVQQQYALIQVGVGHNRSASSVRGASNLDLTQEALNMYPFGWKCY